MAPSQPQNFSQYLVVPSESTSAEPASSLLASTEDASPTPQAFARMRGLGSGSNSARHGSRTITITPTPAQEVPAGILRLRADDNSEPEQQLDAEENTSGRRSLHVQWTEGTVDNEGMYRKKSKVCCIFRKQRQFGESDSDESDSSCCSDSDGDSPNEYERVPKRNSKQKRHATDEHGRQQPSSEHKSCFSHHHSS